MEIRNVALQAKSLSSKKFKQEGFLKTKENNLENVRVREMKKKMQRLERDF